MDKRRVEARLTIGDLYTGLYKISRRGSDLNHSIESYRLLVKSDPGSPLADDALYKTGNLYLKYRKNPEAAYIEFDKILRRYADGDQAEKAASIVKSLSVDIITENGEKKASKTAGAAGVSRIKHWSNPDYTRVVIYAGRKALYKETFLKKNEDGLPPRLFIDISDARLGPELSQPLKIEDGLLKMARAGQFDNKTVRVVLDIESIDRYNIFSLDDPFRIVMDVYGERHGNSEGESIGHIIQEVNNSKQEILPEKPEKQPEEIYTASHLGNDIRKVVIDPGHGGKDSGAVGYRGLKEKDIVLDVGKKLRSELIRRFGVEVIMTRETDIFIPLEERTAIANTVGADIFISLHLNASRNRNANGIETYFLNVASDEDSMRLAAKENATSQKNMTVLQAILNDLMLVSKVNESSRLARHVQGSMLASLNNKDAKHVNRGVKQAPFYVLIGAQMPSILVEMSFITNADDAKRLSKDVFQRDVASAIAGGIEKYSSLVKMASTVKR